MCFAIIAGKKATEDGSVLVGHNEQNAGPNLIHYRRIPRRQYTAGTVVKLDGGGTLPQVEETYSYLWVESPGLEFSDNCFNEWGVAIAGNGCPTKEDCLAEVIARGDIVDGGIGYMLPRLLAERSCSARQAVELATSLLDQFGYTGSGRSLIIADPQEAWVLAIARGRHYLAQRVPDDAVVIIPNTHVIRSEARLADTENVKASQGLMEYARQRGWDSTNQGAFSFADAFGAPQASGMEREWGICSRQWQVQALVSGKRMKIPCEAPQPFAVAPAKPINVADMARLLRSHQEGTEYDLTAQCSHGSPHEPEADIDNVFARCACNIATQESVIWQLRDNLPKELGCIAWRATGVPCVSVYTPWYLAVEEIPGVYNDCSSLEDALDLRHHFNPCPDILTPDIGKVYWTFQQLAQAVELEYGRLAPPIQAVWGKWEQEQFAWQSVVEQTALELQHKDQGLAKNYLAAYSKGQALAAWQQAQEMLRTLLSERGEQ